MKFKKNLDLNQTRGACPIGNPQVFELPDDERRRIAREFEAVEEAIEDVVRESSRVLAKKAKFCSLNLLLRLTAVRQPKMRYSKLFLTDSSTIVKWTKKSRGSAAADSFCLAIIYVL